MTDQIVPTPVAFEMLAEVRIDGLENPYSGSWRVIEACAPLDNAIASSTALRETRSACLSLRWAFDVTEAGGMSMSLHES